MSERVCNLLDNLRNSPAEAVTGVEGSDMVPGRPISRRRCRHDRSFMRFLTHRYTPIATEDDQRSKNHSQSADTPLLHGTCEERAMACVQADEINHDC